MLKEIKFLVPLTWVAAAAWLVAGCGPMNPKPTGSSAAGISSTASSCSAIDGEDPAATGIRHPSYSANKTYLVSAHLKGADPTAAERPLKGENDYTLRVVRAADLTAAPPNLQATATYFKLPKKPTTHPYTANVTKESDGTYNLTTSFQKRSGTFQVHVELTDGDEKDEYVFTIVYSAPAT